ncbi:MAG: DUF1553 domain-containing protein [Candidatus Riflebacteria bacterium]|nr:DUF1553 domain-containing protein [Candidatus Riflebacteria bacterium]
MWTESNGFRRLGPIGSLLLVVATLLSTPDGGRAGAPPVPPFEIERPASTSPIDPLVLATLEKRGVVPAHLCSDQVFVRRVHLDVIGTLPTPDEVKQFLGDTGPDKRSALIDRLLGRREFADFWSLKWCDLLRVKSEFPSNLWPNAVQAYHRWVHDAIRDGWPYDRFVRELLTSSGSNFRVPQVNVYRAVQGRTPEAIATSIALTFMGVRLARWPAADRARLAAFFSRVAYKGTSEWKEEIVLFDPAPNPPVDAAFPGGEAVRIPSDRDPRLVFADWLIKPDNPWFGRNIVNRVWAWLLGRGIIHEPDDLRQDNPPVHPEVLALLEQELVKARYDLRHIFRLILNSQTYQQSSIPQGSHPDAEALFACYPVRQLDAEVLIDAICGITGVGEDYWSAIPEPFTFIPEYQRTITLADGSIGSAFLEMFGRPARDTGLEAERNAQPTEAQRLHMLNSTHIQRKLARSDRLKRLVRVGRNKPAELIRLIYLGVLSRPPTDEELAAVERYARTIGLNAQQIGQDLIWALFNTKEFLYRH